MPTLSELAGEAGGEESRRLAAFWKAQIDEVGDSPIYKAWYKRGEEVEKRYRDERGESRQLQIRRYNALWSNIQILQPALYGKCPIPIAERRFKDKDPIGRGAATILERGLRNLIEVNNFHESVSLAVLDYLLPGRGTVWVRYEPIIEEGPSLDSTPQTDMEDAEGDIKSGKSEPEELEESNEEGEEEEQDDSEAEETEDVVEDHDEVSEEEVHDQQLEATGSRVLRESTPVDYLPWKDFYALPARARTWSEVTSVAKKVYMSRDQLKRRFGKKIGAAIPFQTDQRSKTPSQEMGAGREGLEKDKGEVYEIWSRQDSKVYWIAEGYEYLCDEMDDPLELDGFFPTPRPLFANATSTSLVPVPDYYQYQDQAIQIDELTQRINMLTKACKVAGVYNASAKDIQRLFNEGVDNQLLPVDDWAAFAEKGGVEGNISFIPLKEIMGVLNELQQVKQVQIEEMDRLTGINDIMRGTSDARETLGGVRLKSNNTGTRLSNRQDEVARFARDTVKIMADIMCKHFSPQSLVEVSGALYAEGLGPSDMPPLTDLMGLVGQIPNAGMPGFTPAAGGAVPPMPMGPQGAMPGAMLPPMGGMPPQMPPMPPQQPPMPGMPPQMGTGTSLVPVQPSGIMQPGMGMPPQPPQIPPQLQAQIDAIQRIIAAIQLIRDERLIGFRVDIEVDSTIYGDSAQDKQDRVEFIKATTDYLQQAMLMATQMPEMAPLLGKFLQFGVRSFKIGRDLEAAIEETVDELPQLIKQRIQMGAQQPQPDLIKAQAEMIKAQAVAGDSDSKRQVAVMNAQADIAQGQQKMQIEQAKGQADVMREQIESEGERVNAAIEMAKVQKEIAAQQQQSQIDIEIANLEKEMKLIDLRIKVAELRQKEQSGQQQIITGQQNLQAKPYEADMERSRATQMGHQAEAEGHKASQVGNQQEVERQRTQQAGINAEAAKYKAQHPQPKSNEGGSSEKSE